MKSARYLGALSALAMQASVPAAAVGLVVVASPALAEKAPIAPLNLNDGVAVKGYDPVAYFTDGKPVKGDPRFETVYKGARYHFASAEHRARFAAHPEQYAPQYGGYCAFAIALNKIADISPERWAIVDQKLYLNNGVVAQTLWSNDKPGHIVKATATGQATPRPRAQAPDERRPGLD